MNLVHITARAARHVALTGILFMALPAWSQPTGSPRPAQSGAARELPGVRATRDLEYARIGERALLLDLYLPEQAAQKRPLIVWVHGGGWAAGDKSGCPARRMAQRGYAVASIDYRLSGEAIFPAQIEDCKAAIRWLRANAGKYHIDPDRIGVWGSSAGGHLVALLGTSGDVQEFERGANAGVSSCVQAVCDYYGPTDLAQMDAHAIPTARMKHDLPNSPEARLLGGPVQENKDKAARANPITYASGDDPPFLIVHGDQDPTVAIHQSQLLFDALQKSGVDVHFHTIRGAGHGQGFGGRDVEDMVDRFFDRCLRSAGAGRKPQATRSESAAVNMPPIGANVPGQNRTERRVPFTFEQILAREDANGDGRVTRAEFKGPPAVFDRLDRNHDGVLTKEDFAEPAPQGNPPTDTPGSGSQRRPDGR